MQILKTNLLLTLALALLAACQPKTLPKVDTNYQNYPIYNGSDLGLIYRPGQSQFKVWSPSAEAMRLNIYSNGQTGAPLNVYKMRKDAEGVWSITLKKDLKGMYYAFQARHNGRWSNAVTDPYTKAVGVNGLRGQIIDMADTNPEGWNADRRPPLQHPTDIIIYELHVRDMTIHPSSGSSFPGKYLGLVEAGTTSPQGLTTGLDHLKEMGITHVHLIPVFDHRSVDESKLDVAQYNWGYDPLNYNVPEGSFSTDPYDGTTRIKEFKTMVKTLHDNGIRVILDVVYNHTGQTEESIFNQLVPGYYYRQNSSGGYSNASACGNETASERPMFRKYMLESMRYWVEEYHLDGFRVDLMGIHDIATMNDISAALHRIDPSIFIYGEGWRAGDSPLPEAQLASKANTPMLNNIAAFSDDIRDAIKGHVFTHDARGFISGQEGLEESIRFGIVAATQHPQVDYSKINYSKAPWAPQPSQCMTYVSCHDNHTLWDRLQLSRKEATEAQRLAMHKLAGTIVLTSQGVAFLHAGVEMARTKQGVENSFNSPDNINQIDWARKAQYQDLVQYYQGLIAIRKAHPAFRMTTSRDIQRNLQFLNTAKPLLVAYTLNGAAVGDSWKNILVAFNGSDRQQDVQLPPGNWRPVIQNGQINSNGFDAVLNGQASVAGNSALVVVQM